MTWSKTSGRLSKIASKGTREKLNGFTGLTFNEDKEKGRHYYVTKNKGKTSVRPLSGDAFKSYLSLEVFAAYWLVTNFYPKSIANKVKGNQGSKHSANIARREPSPPADTTGGEQ